MKPTEIVLDYIKAREEYALLLAQENTTENIEDKVDLVIKTKLARIKMLRLDDALTTELLKENK